MNNSLTILLSGAAGAALGVIFFGGLWWTVRRGMTSPRPAVWFAGSLMLRISVVMFGFYFVSGGDWQRLAACLIGFVLARIALTRFTKAPIELIEKVHDAT